MSGEIEKETATSRSKDGVPIWNGEASSFAAYEESALLWEQGLVYNKRYTAAPRLMAELTGAAKRLVAGKPAEGLATAGGVRLLLDYLRKSLGKPRVNEVTDLLGKYFKGTRRRPGESMNDYITRKSEAFLRVSQALRRVQPHYQRAKPVATTWESRGRRDSDLSSSWAPWNWSRQTTGNENGADDADGDGDEDQDDGQRPSEAGTGWSNAQDTWDGWRSGYGGWGWNSYGWNYDYSTSYWQPQNWYGSGASTASAATWKSIETVEDEGLLPSFIQGWYLLTDAALDANERNLVTTALAGDFTPARVAQELRNQFSEADLKRRDSSRRGHAYMGVHDDDEGGAGEEVEWDPQECPGDEGDDDAETALIADIESETHLAWAAFQQARRTLKDARVRQHSNKLNRQYYRGNGGFKSNAGGQKGGSNDENIECLRCGRRGHRVANCPEKPLAARGGPTSSGTSPPTQQAPFVCGSGPILLSVDALRTLGALVDFRNDLMVLTALNDRKIIPLKRSATGHQLLSLTDDLFSQAHDAISPVPTLGSLVSH